jgi:hypothetical protein
MDEILHRQARDAAGDLLEHLASKSSAYMVAILWHDLPFPLTHVDRESFMFVKCSAKITVGKIREQYLLRDNVTSAILLYQGLASPPATARMSDLDYFGDRIVVFHARPPFSVGTTPASTSAQTGHEATLAHSKSQESGQPSASSFQTPSMASSRPATPYSRGPSGPPTPVLHQQTQRQSLGSLGSSVLAHPQSSPRVKREAQTVPHSQVPPFVHPSPYSQVSNIPHPGLRQQGPPHGAIHTPTHTSQLNGGSHASQANNDLPVSINLLSVSTAAKH